MITMIIYTIISFLLDGLMSNYIGIYNISYLMTIYTVISFTIAYSYFENKKKYLYIVIIMGILFDIVYSNTFLLNIVIFLLIYFVLDKLDYYITNNAFTINLKAIICVSIYHILSYMILRLVNYLDYGVSVIITMLYKNIIMTIIYTTISYLIMKKVMGDKKIK